MSNALIWGGTGGIGGALVHALAAQQWTVASIGRQIESSAATIALQADVMYADEIANAVLEVAQTLGEIDLWSMQWAILWPRGLRSFPTAIGIV